MTLDTTQWFAGHYLADASHGTDWRVSPLRAKTLAGLFDDSMPGPPPLVNPNPVVAYGKSTGSGTNRGGGGGGAHESAKAGGSPGH